MLWLIVLKLLKAGRSTDRFGGPALAPHGTHFRGNAIRTLFNDLVTRNHKLGSFKNDLSRRPTVRLGCG